jgi:hypothetical protein
MYPFDPVLVSTHICFIYCYLNLFSSHFCLGTQDIISMLSFVLALYRIGTVLVTVCLLCINYCNYYHGNTVKSVGLMVCVTIKPLSPISG